MISRVTVLLIGLLQSLLATGQVVSPWLSFQLLLPATPQPSTLSPILSFGLTTPRSPQPLVGHFLGWPQQYDGLTHSQRQMAVYEEDLHQYQASKAVATSKLIGGLLLEEQVSSNPAEQQAQMKQVYQLAFHELLGLTERADPRDLKRVVYLMESPFLEDRIDYKAFSDQLSLVGRYIIHLSEAKGGSRAAYYNTLYQVLLDSTWARPADCPLPRPIGYDFYDPFGF